MQNLKNNYLYKNHDQLSNILEKDIDNIKEFVNTANSRLDAIISVTNNSHAIVADALTAMICERQESLYSKRSVNTTNKMSVCLRDGEIILRYVTFLLITNDESIFQKSCLKDLKNNYIALGLPLSNAVRIIELIREATISEIKTTVNYSDNKEFFVDDLIQETKFYFQKIINLFN